MPNLTEEILVTLQGRDNASQVVNGFASNAQSSLNGISSRASSDANALANTYQSTFQQIGNGIHQLNSGFISLSSANGLLMNELGSTKSAMDWVYGTTSREDTNKVLVKTMVSGAQDIESAYESLYEKIDKTTDGSLTSMQDLIPAMNAFKSATQATPEQLENDVAENMAEFGAFVLAQTGSEQLALTAMMDLSKGIKGQFAALDQYGVSLASMENTGLWKQDTSGSGKKWKGDEHDIQGYMAAVRSLIGGTDELMNTNEGLNAQMGKMWSRAGKRIGHEVMPGLKSLKQTFIDLDQEMNGDLSTAVLRVSLAIEESHQKIYELNTLFDSANNIMQIARGVMNYFTVATEGNSLAQQGNSEALAQNTLEIDANTEAKLANADASLAMSEASYGSMVAEAYPATAGTAYSSTDALTDMAIYGGGDVGAEAMRQLWERNDNIINAGDNRFLNPDEYLPGYSPKFEMYSTEGMRSGKDILGVGYSPMGKLKPESMDDYNNYIKSLTDEIPKVNVKNQSDYGRVIKDLMDNTVVDDDTFDDAFKKLGGNIDDLNAYIKLKDKHEGAIQELTQQKVNIENMMSLGRNEGAEYLPILERKIAEHEVQSAHLDVLKDSDEGFITGLTNWVKKDADDKIDLSKALANEEAEMTLSKALGLKKESTQKSLTKKGKSIKAKPGEIFEGLTDSYKGAKQGILNFGKTAKEIEDSADKGLLQRLDFALFNPFRKTPPVDDAVDGAKKVIKGGEELAEGAGTAGVIGGEMAAAEGGLSFMALSEMGLAGAFTTLIVPTLAIAGVIAVLIPVVAGLAIEALFFINLVGQVMSAMNWDDIDVEDAVANMQSLAEAFAWLGLAMGAMTFAGIMSGIGMAVAGLLSIVGGFPQVVNLLTQVASEIQPLGEITVDEGIAENLSNLSGALNSISMAMLSLVGIQLTSWLAGIVTGFGLFGTIGDSIDRAKGDIEKAVSAINGLNVSGIDENKANQLKVALDAIKSFSDAFSGLAGMRTDEAISDFTSWLLSGGIFGNGGKSISEAITSAQKDIEEASEALSHFTNVSEIDETTVERLSKAGEAIKAMGDAFEGLRKIRDDKNFDAMFDDGGIFGFLKGKHDIASALDEAKGDIVKISQSLKGLDGKLADIPDNVGERLQKVSDTLTSISGAIEALKKINDAGGKKNKNFDKYVESIKIVKKDLIKVSKELKGFNGDENGKGGLADITNSGIDTKLNAITGTLANIAEAIANLDNINAQTSKGKKMDGYVTMLKTVRKDIVKVGNELKKFDTGGKGGKGALADISGLGIDSKLKAISTTLENVANAIGQLNNINATIGDGSKMDEYVTMIQNAKVGLSKVSKELKNLSTGEGKDKTNQLLDIPKGLDSKIKSVATTLANIAMAFVNLKNIYTQNATQDEDGFSGYVTMIQNAKIALSKVSEELHNLSDGKGNDDIFSIDKGLATKIKTVTSTLTEVDSALSEMQSIFTNFGGKGEQPGNGKSLNLSLGTNVNNAKGNKEVTNIDQYKQTIQNGATALVEVSGILKNLGGKKGGLSGVGKGVTNKIKNIKDALSALSSTAKIMKKFPKMSGDEVPRRVQKAVTALQNSAKYLRNINSKDKVGKNVTNVISNIGKAVKSLKETLKTIDFKPEGEGIGDKIKKGIKTGLGDLSKTVSGKITDATNSATTSATTLGTTIAKSLNLAFQTALNLTGIVAQQIQQAQLQVNNSTTDLNNGADVNTGNPANPTGNEGQDTGGDWLSNLVNAGSNAVSNGPNRGINDFVGITRRMVNSGYNNLNLNKFNQNRINGLNNMNSKSKMGKNDRNVSIHIGEGAIQLDARNLTTKESRQVMINALEGLNAVKGVRL